MNESAASSEIEIRLADPSEGDEIGALTESAYRGDGFTDDDYAAELLDGAARVRDAIVLVATLRGRIVGSVTLAPPGSPFVEIGRPDELEVRMLAVADEARRRGVADRLMEASEALARSLGLSAMVLSTDRAMHAAHRLYERRGYVRQPDRDWKVGDFVLLSYWLGLGDRLTGSPSVTRPFETSRELDA